MYFHDEYLNTAQRIFTEEIKQTSHKSLNKFLVIKLKITETLLLKYFNIIIKRSKIPVKDTIKIIARIQADKKLNDAATLSIEARPSASQKV